MKQIIVVLLMLMAGLCQAGLFEPAVENGSFEDGALTEGEWAYNVGAPWGEVGFRYLESNVAAGWVGLETPHGNNSVRTGGGGELYIEIGTWDPDTDYIVTLWIGQRDESVSTFIVGELWAGGASGYAAIDALLGDNTGATWVDYHWFSVPDLGGPISGDLTWTYNSSANNAGGLSVGDPLWIRFAGGDGADLNIDNIRVVQAVFDFALLVAPGNGETNVPVDTILEWDPSPDHELSSSGYEVFFGAEPNELNPNYDMGSPVYSGLNESFDPDKPGTTDADLEWDTTYYWRVDYYEPNAPDPDILWQGLLWSFTTAPAIPVIIQSPVNTTVPAGTDASLTVETRNAERYEWYKVGSPDQLIVARDSTAETDTLTISGTQQGDEGLYYCKVINSAAPDGVDSSTALVMTERLVARWEFENNLNDTNPYPTKRGGSIVDPDTANAVLPNISFVTDGAAIQGDYALHIDNMTGQGYVLIDGSEGAFDFYRTGLTVSAWIKRVDFPALGGWWDPIITYPGFQMMSVEPDNWLNAEISGVGWVGWLNGVAPVNDGNWHLLTMTFDGSILKAYLDGAHDLEISGTPAVVEELRSLTIGGFMGDVGDSDRLTATLDDIQVYSYAISSADVAKLYTDIAGGTICVQDDDSLPSLQWDLSGNCRIDLADLALFAADWQNCREVPTCLP